MSIILNTIGCILANILLFSPVALFFYSLVASHSFSPTMWRRGLIVFREIVKNPVTPNPSLIGHEVTFEGVVAKVIDERTCLFREGRREGFLNSRRPISPLLGEIRFSPKGYLVLGRLQWSQILTLFILLMFTFSAYFSKFGNLSGPILCLLPLAFTLIVIAVILSLILVVGPYSHLRNVYPKVIDWVQSGKNE